MDRWPRHGEEFGQIADRIFLGVVDLSELLLGSGEVIPESVVRFIGDQFGMSGAALLTYANRRQTRHEHLVALRQIHGYRIFTGKRARRMKAWLDDQAETAQSSEARHFRTAGPNLLTAAIIHWNTDRLGRAVRKRRSTGLETPDGLLKHISPLGWDHMLITGECRWPGTTA